MTKSYPFGAQQTYPFSAPITSVVPTASSALWFRDDFVTPANVTFGALGTGANTLSAGGGGGRREMGIVSSTATAVADLAAWIINGAAASPLVGGIASIQTDIRAAIPTLSDGVNNSSLRLGVAAIANVTVGDLTDGAYFESDYPNHGNSPVWFACTAKASVRTKVSTGVSPVAGVHQRFRIVNDAALATVTFYINEVQVAVISANVPTATMSTFGQLIKSLGAAIHFAIYDYVEITANFTNGVR